MTKAESIQKLEDPIGYPFEDKDVIEKALTRIAFLNDQQKKAEENSMGPLATVGDAVLSCVVAYKMYSDEKNRTKQKISQSGQKTLDVRETRSLPKKINLDNLSTGKRRGKT